MKDTINLNLRVWHGPPAQAAIVKAALERRFPLVFEMRPITHDGTEVRVNLFHGPYDLVTFTEEEARLREYAERIAEGKA